MKLLDILLVETTLANMRPGDVVDRRTTDTNLVIEVQRQLKRHRLVGGELTFNNGQAVWSIDRGMAWTGPEDGVWSPAMDQAVRAWHESINAQLASTRANAPSQQLEVNNSIGHEDQQWLRAELDPQGLLIRADNPEENVEAVDLGNWAFSRQLVNQDVNTVNDAQTFLSGIGESGWISILTFYSNRIYGREDGSFSKNRQQRLAEIQRWLTEYIFRAAPSGDQFFTWYNRAEANVFRENFPIEASDQNGANYQNLVRMMAEKQGVAAGSVQLTVWPEWMGNFPRWEPTDFWKVLYLHFATIATIAFNNNEQLTQQRATDAAEDAAARRQNDTVNLSSNDIQSAAQRFYDAVDGPGTDEDAIGEVYATLRNALDYDALEDYWRDNFSAQRNGETMDEVALGELSSADYDLYVVRYLRAIRRIAPERFFSTINFGDQDSITVTIPSDVPSIGGNEYIISSTLGPNSSISIDPDVNGRIQEDTVLRVAVTESGATVPDLFVEPTQGQQAAAAARFVEVMNGYAPFMHRYYVGDVPFEGTDLATIGMFRLRAIVDRIILFGAADPTSMIIDEIDSDIRFLVGTSPDDENRAANIYFDPLYQNEGDFDGFIPEGEEPLELSDEAEEYIQRFLGNEEMVFEATRELVDLPNFKDLYVDEIYPGFFQQVRRPLERVIGDRSTVRDAHEGTLDNTAFAIIIRELDSVPLAAPKTYANFLTEVLRSDRSVVATVGDLVAGDSPEEELLGYLNRITDQQTFERVDHYYDGDLLADIIAFDLDDADIERLARQWGQNSVIDPNTAEDVSPEVTEAVNSIVSGIDEIISDENLQRLDELENLEDVRADVREALNALFDNEDMSSIWESDREPGDNDLAAANRMISRVRSTLSERANSSEGSDVILIRIIFTEFNRFANTLLSTLSDQALRDAERASLGIQ